MATLMSDKIDLRAKKMATDAGGRSAVQKSELSETTSRPGGRAPSRSRDLPEAPVVFPPSTSGQFADTGSPPNPERPGLVLRLELCGDL